MSRPESMLQACQHIDQLEQRNHQLAIHTAQLAETLNRYTLQTAAIRALLTQDMSATRLRRLITDILDGAS